MRILLVEDQAALREPMAAGLRKVGFAVDTAASLAEADELLAVGAIDLMILDLGLPDGDGRVYLARLRRADRKSVVEGKSVSVRVDLGGSRSIKKKTTEHKEYT